MKNVKVTKRANAVEYAIRDVMVHADKLSKMGKKIFYMNIGDPVAFDFTIPQHIKQALIDAVEEGANSYSPSEGLPELRQAIAEKERRVNGVSVAPDNVIVTAGISEGIEMTIAALVDEGDEILVPGPAYPPYVSYSRFFGGVPIAYETIENEGWQPNIDDLRKKISAKTCAIVIINPNNPTGALYGKKVVKQITDIAGEYGLPVISDEIYDQIRYKDDNVSTAHLAKDVPVIGFNGFSKVHLITGWRLGYIYFSEREGELQHLKEAIAREGRVRICANTPVQKAGVVALKGPQDHVRDLVEKLRIRRDFAWKRMSEIEGITCSKPEGAFYFFPKIREVGSRWRTDMDFVIDLLQNTGVLLVHGSGFDPVYGKGHTRGVFLPPVEDMEKAFSKVETFMKNK